MKTEDCRHLAAGLEGLRTIQVRSLLLSNNLLDDEKVRTILSINPSRLHSLQVLGNYVALFLDHNGLDLSQNKVSDQGAEFLAESSSYMPQLQTLNLSDNQIKEKGARSLATIIQKSKSITNLDLHLNYLGSEGAKHIWAALRENSTLQKLNLGSNFIGQGEGNSDFGTDLFLSVIKANTALVEIDLSCNEISIDSSGCKLMLASLALNNRLKFIDFRKCPIAPEVQKQLKIQKIKL